MQFVPCPVACWLPAAAAQGRSPSTLDAQHDVARLRQQAVAALGDASLLSPLLAVIRGEYDHAAAVPASVQALVRGGLATVETYPSYRVRPVDAREPSA